MRALIQRVAEARVDIAGETVSRIDAGMLILVCAMRGDGDDEPGLSRARSPTCASSRASPAR